MNLNCILVGDCKVGKTRLLSYFRQSCKKHYVYIPTIGVDFHVYKTLHIWDTSGDPRFMSITKTFIRSSDLCILCYSDEKSFNNLRMYIRHVSRFKKNKSKLLILSFGKDYEWEVEGIVLSNLYGCQFMSCDIERKEKCVEFLEKLVNRHKIETKEMTTIERDRYCWWNWW